MGLSALALLALTSSPGAAGLLLAALASTSLDLLGAMKLWQVGPSNISQALQHHDRPVECLTGVFTCH